ncbi:MAG: sigma-70 family RNA polymerase sigma factor [Planctomycetota bacterium]
MSDITRLLDAVRAGESSAESELLALVYGELRQLAKSKMAREPSNHTLQATALVHEAWLRLGDQRFENRTHFFGAAAEAMRRILIDRARRKIAAKHGGQVQHVLAEDVEITAPTDKDDELLVVHEALDQLDKHDTRKAELVKLRYFVGLTIDEAADVLEISTPTAKRDWAYARAWLYRTIEESRE